MPANPYDGAEFGKRLRAARAYAGFDQRTLGLALGISHNILRAAENGERSMNEGDVYMAAKACGVPMEFFSVDWSALRSTDEAEQLQRIETKIDGGLDLLAEALSAGTMDNIRSALQEGDELDELSDESGEQGPAT